MREDKEFEHIIYGLVYWGVLIFIVALFDPEMGCGILGVSITLFIALQIIEVLS